MDCRKWSKFKIFNGSRAIYAGQHNRIAVSWPISWSSGVLIEVPKVRAVLCFAKLARFG